MLRKVFVLLLIIVLVLSVAGCGCVRLVVTTHPDFSVQYIRTNGYHADIKYPVTSVIGSVQDLSAYYAKNKDFYDLERRGHVASDYTIGFLDAVDKYDEAYFTDHLLVLVLLEEGSGSNRHLVKDVYSNNGLLNILIERQIPQIGTTDMAEWHIIIELKKSDYHQEDIKVYLSEKRA